MAVCIALHIDQVAADPVGLGRRAAFPYRPVGQIFEFWCGDEYFITLFFHYLPGEQSIQIFAVGFRRYATGPGDP